MKNLILAVLCIALTVTLCACGSSKAPEPDTDPITAAITKRVKSSDYYNAEVESVSINDDLGTDAAGDKIVTARLKFTAANNGATAKSVLRIFSDDLAATVYKECPDVNEIVFFWTATQLNNAEAKCAYQRRDTGMAATDEMWAAAFD